MPPTTAKGWRNQVRNERSGRSGKGFRTWLGPFSPSERQPPRDEDYAFRAEGGETSGLLLVKSPP